MIYLNKQQKQSSMRNTKQWIYLYFEINFPKISCGYDLVKQRPNVSFSQLQNLTLNMINSLHSRPQSYYNHRLKVQARPITRVYDQEQAQKCFKMGKQHQGRKQIQRAQMFYLQATIHNPNSFKAYCNLGTCLKMRGKFEQATEAYLKAKSIQPQDSITNYNLANVYRIIGDEQKAIKLYHFVIQLKQKQGIQIGQLYLDSYTNLGVCYRNIGNYNKAIECFQLMKKAYPNDSGVIFNQASCYMKVLRDMVKNNNSSSNLIFQNLLKQTLLKTVQLYELVLKSSPENQVALLSLIQLKSIQDQSTQMLSQCLNQLNEIINKKGTSASTFVKQQVSRQKAYCLNLLKKYEQSAKEYRKATQNSKANEEKSTGQQKRLMEQKRKIQQQQVRKHIKQNQEKEGKVKVASQEPEATKQGEQPTLQVTKISHTPHQPYNQKQTYLGLLNKLIQNADSILSQHVQQSNESLQDKCLQALQTLLEKNTRMGKGDGRFDKRVRNELKIVMYSVLSEKLSNRQFMLRAFQVYIDYLLPAGLQTKIPGAALFIQTHRAIASVLTGLGHSQKAIQHYQIISEEFINAQITDKYPLQQLHSGLGVNYQSQGLYEKAIFEFRKAIQLNPSNYVLNYNLGYCLDEAGLQEQAVESYTRFLEQVRQQPDLDQRIRESYVFQALISLLICSSKDSCQQKMAKCSLILQKLQEQYSNTPSKILEVISPQNLLRFYLKSCDVFQQGIEEEYKKTNQRTNYTNVKNHKQKLFNVYVSLIQLPNCPDKDQILINCANMLYQQKQYLNALGFYQRVNKQKYQVFNNMALAFMQVGQHFKALQYMEEALKKDQQNQIYRLNLAMLRWAFGVNSQTNLLFIKYPCNCDRQYNNRVQFAKSLIVKLTNYLQKLLLKQKYSESKNTTQNITQKELFQVLLSEQQAEEHWKQVQSKRKHQFLRQNIQKHMTLVKHEQTKQFDSQQIKYVLGLILQNNKKEQLRSNFLQLIKRLDYSQQKWKDQLTIMEQLISIFIYLNSKEQKRSSTLKQVLNQVVKAPPSYSISFKDDIATNLQNFPNKRFSVIYPSIQLKIQNIIQSFVSWQMLLQDQIGYLFRIIQTIAYKHKLRQSIYVQYNFPYCRNVHCCERCMKKSLRLFSCVFHFQLYSKILSPQLTNLTIMKQQMCSNFTNQLNDHLQKRLTYEKQDKILDVQLCKQTLPLQLQIIFVDVQSAHNFIKQLCSQLSVDQLEFAQEAGQVEIVLNKLIRFRVRWKQLDNALQIIKSITCSKMGLKNWSINVMDVDLLRTWNQNNDLRAFLNEVFQDDKFLM